MFPVSMTARRAHAAAWLGLAATGPALAATDATGSAAAPLPAIVVSASHFAQDSFTQPAAISVVDAAQIGAALARVNASEALAAVPGLVVQNRQNYAQDLQISSRGFGARSAFGVRGVRLIADGIPASMPDGQGQAATFNLDTAERIEVLRGPFSALYGNHAGGVIQLFSKDGQGAPSVDSLLTVGSYGSRKADFSAQGSSAGVGYVIDVSRFDTDGYRAHSAARRDQQFAKLTLHPGAGGKLTLVASSLQQDGTQDPLGVTWATYQRDRRAGETDANDTAVPRRTLAERYNTRKNIDHQQAGMTYEQQFGDDRLQATLYGGNRHVLQYQSFSRFLQAPASNSGGVIDFDRDFYGMGVNWQHVRQLAGGKLTATAGFDYARSDDDRQGYENFVGEQFGVKGALRRNEDDRVASLDPYLQAQWEQGRWQLTAGLRHSSMRVKVRDRYLANGNDSGAVRYQASTPLLGLLYRVTPTLNLYASAARGFEAPTLNEMFYSGAGGGFNYQLKPSRSRHLELGAKAAIGAHKVELALFQVRTSDELVVDTASGGRTSYRNGGSTLRRGIELSLDSHWTHGWRSRIAATQLHAVYDGPFGSVPSGRRLPGVPGANLYGELSWQNTPGSLTVAAEALASGRVYADDANASQPAPGYAVLNLRAQTRQQWGPWRLTQFARLNNAAGREYVGSVIVGDSNKRYYEAAPVRNWVLGMGARYQF